MAERGGQPGNTNATKGKPWTHAIQKALEIRGRKDKLDALVSIADTLLDKAKEGDMQAIKELGDRLEGKPMQAIERTDTRTITLIERKIVQVEDKSQAVDAEIIEPKQLEGAEND